MTRPSWAEVRLQQAQILATRSLCIGGAGCIITDGENRIVAEGYAGPPRSARTAGLINCRTICARQTKPVEQRDPGYMDCQSIHAEQNALILADYNRMDGGTAYITRQPCHACMKMLSNTKLALIQWPTGTVIIASLTPQRG